MSRETVIMFERRPDGSTVVTAVKADGTRLAEECFAADTWARLIASLDRPAAEG